MFFKREKSTDIKREIIKLISQNGYSTKNYRIGYSLYKYINKYNLAVFGSIVHRMLSKSKYNIDNMDVLIHYRHKERIRLQQLSPDVFIKNANTINFSSNIKSHDIIVIGCVRINFIYTDINPDVFVYKHVPYYFLKNFYYKKFIFQAKEDLMKEMTILPKSDHLIKKYTKRGVKFKFIIDH